MNKAIELSAFFRLSDYFLGDENRNRPIFRVAKRLKIEGHDYFIMPTECTFGWRWSHCRNGDWLSPSPNHNVTGATAYSAIVHSDGQLIGCFRVAGTGMDILPVVIPPERMADI